MEMERISKIDLRSLPDPGSLFKLGLRIGGGVGGDVFEAIENETGKKVAIKMIDLTKETEDEINQEFYMLKTLSANENFPEFYGIYLKKGKDAIQRVWLVIEFCEGGTAADFARKLEQENKKMIELYVAYIMRETIKAVIHLHENKICHRDIRGSNILLTEDGRVKLVDFGISKRLEEGEKTKTRIGSPNWLAPEVITNPGEDSKGYDKKADVWALGITAMELGDGQAPFENVHPARILFQIVQNPPPTLQKPMDWSRLYNDFIGECLVKDPENRPYVQELLAHTFFEAVDTEENLQNNIKIMLKQQKTTNLFKKSEVQVKNCLLKTDQRSAPERILEEDLAALTEVSEDSVLEEIYERFKKQEFQTYVGDILLVLNPNKKVDTFGKKFHKKYQFKGKSQNAPHVYAVADSAYRDVFHHQKQQHILFAGETGSGKTFNMMHAIDHLLFLGYGLKSSEKVRKALEVIQTLGNASTSYNSNSTRHVLKTQLSFTDTGKVSGGIFRIYQLEKERVTATGKNCSNFHIFYYFYDAIASEKNLIKFKLDDQTSYKFLKLDEMRKPLQKNIESFKLFENNLRELEFEESKLECIKNILAAILSIGEIEFAEDEDENGTITTMDLVNNVAELLGVDKKKFSWALVNYCFIIKGEAMMRHNSKEEAEEAKKVLARGIYSRLVDWIINAINEKLSVSRVVYGDKHIISLLDMFGFECYKKNSLDQLFVNILNEQLQFHYNQKIFIWEKFIAEEEGIAFPDLEFTNNKEVIDLIMSKSDGLLQKIDEATRNDDPSAITENLPNSKSSPIFAETSQLFSINHYTGKITYDANDIKEKNKDFLPPELIETMRLSENQVTKELFSSMLTKSGNLSALSNPDTKEVKKKARENKLDTNPLGKYSQSRQMRTSATTFRGACFDLFKSLGINECGFHFVRCLKADLSNKPDSFHPEVVRQQLRALGVVNTVLTTQKGYSYSVSHSDFIKRYKFMAFDFDENVEETKENCRLLLLRLKLEGWTMGKTKVFLKYYNKEYLSRLYETQIKKIVKVQSMMRAFMARRKLYAKIKKYQVDADKLYIKEEQSEMYLVRSEIHKQRFQEDDDTSENTTSDPNYEDLNEKQIAFIKPWCKRWKAKTIFQVLLLYRADRLQALVNFCLQIHLCNQKVFNDINLINLEINLNNIDENANHKEYLPPMKPITYKMPFYWESFLLKGNVSDCDPFPECNLELLESTITDRLSKKILRNQNNSKNFEDKEIQTSINGENLYEKKEVSGEISKQDENEVIDSLQHATPSNLNIDQFSTKQKNITNKVCLENYSNKKKSKENDSAKVTQNEISQTFEKTKYGKVRNFRDNISFEKSPKFKSQNNLQASLKELEEKFNRIPKAANHNDDNEPPFNFRSVLRKTTFSNESKNSVAHYKKASFDFTETKKNLKCEKIQRNQTQSKTIAVELAPGILIHGKIAEL